MQPRILIAHDQADIFPALELLLKCEGFEVATATNRWAARLLMRAFVVGVCLPVATLAQEPLELTQQILDFARLDLGAPLAEAAIDRCLQTDAVSRG